MLERRIEQRQQSKEYPRLAFASGQGVIPLSERKTNNREQLTKDEYTKKYLVTELNDIVYNPANVKYGAIDRNKCGRGLISPIYVTFTTSEIPGFIERIVTSHDFRQRALRFEEGTVTKRQSVNPEDLVTLDILVASKREEQQKIVTYFDSLDNLITLHQRKPPFTRILRKYTKITKETTQMSELERILEEKLIEQLVYGDSQWTYHKDLKTEEDLWENFKYILEQNNKDRLNGEPLSDTEFEQVKNQLQFSSFYKAGEWLVGENGKVQVHVQRDTERLHLVVMNHEHIAGGSSVYEVINQYEALKSDEDAGISERDRRFDVTLLINGLPMIHIELKNKQHSYMEAFRQIKKYIGEGKFTGIFSAVQMFVVSNGVDTRYFAAASDTELNEKFMSGWVDREKYY
nr:type I restriction endonuclease [uncultured Blautia sp.]